MGGDAMVVVLAVAQTPIMVGAALARLPQPAAYPLSMRQGAMELKVMDRLTNELVQGGRAQPIGKIQTPFNASGARGGATWPGNALPNHQL